MAYGDHLVFLRTGYEHHAIDLGDGTVLHYAAPNGKAGARIMHSWLADVAAGCDVRVVPYARRFHPDEVVRRAWERHGEGGYDLVFNNCEHFARWCVTGELRSQQIERAQATAGGGVAAGAIGVAALGTAGAIGTSAGLSGGAGLMTGLAGLGMGGGAVAGLGVAGVAPGVVGTLAMQKVLADDPNLTRRERVARERGRKAAPVGAVLGSAGALGMVAAAGVPGLSAVGITSGLAAIGGGSMALGVVGVVAAPAVAAAGAAYFLYWLAGGGETQPRRP